MLQLILSSTSDMSRPTTRGDRTPHTPPFLIDQWERRGGILSWVSNLFVFQSRDPAASVRASFQAERLPVCSDNHKKKPDLVKRCCIIMTHVRAYLVRIQLNT